MKQAADGTIRQKVLAFFEANPDEELTPQMAVVKFGVHPRTLANVLSKMTISGELESVRVIRVPARGWR